MVSLTRLMQSLYLPVAERVRQAGWQPPADVYRTRDGWLVKFDLAGVRPQDIEVSVSGPHLCVRGTRRDWCLEEGCHHYLMEISYSEFERCIDLPGNLDQACIRTEFREGMLLVRIQREAP
jgi:HSP20 family protein